MADLSGHDDTADRTAREPRASGRRTVGWRAKRPTPRLAEILGRPPPQDSPLDRLAAAQDRMAEELVAAVGHAPETPAGHEAWLAVLRRLEDLRRSTLEFHDRRKHRVAMLRLKRAMGWTGYAMFVVVFVVSITMLVLHGASKPAIVAAATWSTPALGLVIWIWHRMLRDEGTAPGAASHPQVAAAESNRAG